jgi:hypothetical protein
MIAPQYIHSISVHSLRMTLIREQELVVYQWVYGT